MKTYKHKTTGYKAESEGSNPYSYIVQMADRVITLPAQLVEDPGFGWVLQKDYEILTYNTYYDGNDNHINSVKRLSDGEVFSVGDEVERDSGNRRIDIIKEYEESLLFTHGDGWTYFEKAKKVTRKPILTSEDGVEMFEGDERFWIRAINGTGRCTIHVGKVGKKANPELVYFSTREAAEDYRLNHARVLSFNDVDRYYPYILYPRDMKELKNLIKSRLK